MKKYFEKGKKKVKRSEKKYLYFDCTNDHGPKPFVSYMMSTLLMKHFPL